MKGAFWWIDRWRASAACTDLPAEAQALYRNLCDEVWLREDGTIPEGSMARASGFPDLWPKHQLSILAHMTKVPGRGWTSKTAREVMRQSALRAAKQQRYREKKRNAPGNAKGNAPGSPSPSPSPSLTLTTTDTAAAGGRRRANPLVGDRAAREKEVLELVREVAELSDKDPTEVMGWAGSWKGHRQMNVASMTDDRLLNVRLDLGKELRRLRGEQPDSPEPLGPPPADPEAERVWEAALERLRAELPPHIFATWFRPPQAVGCDAEVLTVWCPNEVFLSWVRNNYGKRLAELLAPRRLELIHGGVGGGAE